MTILDALTMLLSGPANGASPLYKWDRNNFQPRISVAWSPRFEHGFLRKIFGDGGDSVIRGGFDVLNDAYGEQIAVTFDTNNSLGFTSNTTIAANTYNTTTKPAPLFTGYDAERASASGNYFARHLDVPAAETAGLLAPYRIFV